MWLDRALKKSSNTEKKKKKKKKRNLKLVECDGWLFVCAKLT